MGVQMKSVVLIGMPGAGKSTVGVILAKELGFQFIDSDLLIQKQEKRLLKDIIAKEGLEKFIEIENKVNCSITEDHSVIATGGSVIYGREAMEHLRKIATVVYIKLPYHTLAERLGNIKQRGVVLKTGQNLKGLFQERCPLYERYAHLIIDADKKNIEEVMELIREEIEKI